MPNEIEDSGYRRIFFNSNNIDSLMLKQNYGFNPVGYMDKNKRNHLVYFSGEGNIVKGICGEFFLHDITISEILPNEDRTLGMKVNQRFPLTGDINRPLRD
jgi:hypothetical protein